MQNVRMLNSASATVSTELGSVACDSVLQSSFGTSPLHMSTSSEAVSSSRSMPSLSTLLVASWCPSCATLDACKQSVLSLEV